MFVALSIFTIILLGTKRSNIQNINIFFTICLIIYAILDLYFAPYGADRLNYEYAFLHTDTFKWNKDPGWGLYTSILYKLTSGDANAFFLINDIIFTGGFVYFAYRNFQRGYLWYFLLIVFISLGYHSGGTNIMRSGLAFSCVFYGLADYMPGSKHKIRFLIWAFLGCAIHLSTALLLCALILCYYFPKKKLYLFIWVVFVVLSYANLLRFLEPVIVDVLGDDSSRIESYLAGVGQQNNIYRNIGFRFDFVIYSVVPIIVGYIYLLKYNYNNKVFTTLYCSYLVINTFWLIVIRIPFGDRFALISWILIPIIMAYPPLTQNNFPSKKVWLAIAILFPTILNIYYLLK